MSLSSALDEARVYLGSATHLDVLLLDHVYIYHLGERLAHLESELSSTLREASYLLWTARRNAAAVPHVERLLWHGVILAFWHDPRSIFEGIFARIPTIRNRFAWLWVDMKCPAVEDDYIQQRRRTRAIMGAEMLCRLGGEDVIVID